MKKLLLALLTLGIFAFFTSCWQTREKKQAREAALDFVTLLNQDFLNIGTSGLADETVLPRLLSEPALSTPYSTIKSSGSAKLVSETEHLIRILKLFPDAAKKGSKVDLFAELGVQKPIDSAEELQVIVKALQAAFFHYADVAGVRADFQARMHKWYNHAPGKAAP